MTNSAVRGILIPIGGNEDKGIEGDEMYTLEFIDEGILAHVVREAGGTNANIVIIPTASSIPDDVAESYLTAFGKLGCENLTVLDIRSREDAEHPDAIEIIKDSDCVMFSGGDQSKITKYIGESTIHQIMSERYKNENFVIAGTSAGAMCMSQEMITGGNATDSFRKGVVFMDKGLGFMPRLIIDSHFIKRGRFGRLTESVAKFPHLVGVGLAEDTGIIIKNNNELKVIGSGMVIIFDAKNLLHNNEDILEEGTPMTITNMTTHVLSNSDEYNVDSRTVTVLPIDAPFV